MTGFNDYKVATVKNLHTWLNNIDNTVIIGTQSDKTLRKIDITNGNYATYSPDTDTTGVYISGYSVGDGKQAYTDDQNVIVQDIEYRDVQITPDCDQYTYTGTVSNLIVPSGLSCNDLLQPNSSSHDSITFDCTITRSYGSTTETINPTSSDFILSFVRIDDTHVTLTITYVGLKESCSSTTKNTVIYTGTIECTGSEGGDDPIITPDDVCDALLTQGSSVTIVNQNLEVYCNDTALNTVDGDIAILVNSSYYPSGAKSTTAVAEGFQVVMEDAPANWDGTTSIEQNGYIIKSCMGRTFQYPFTYTRIPCSPLYIKTIPCIQHGITPQQGTHFFVYKNGALDSSVTATVVSTTDFVWTITATSGSDTATSVLTVCPYFTMSYNTTDFNGTQYPHNSTSATNIQGPGQDPSYGDTLTFTVTPSDQNSILYSIEVEVLGDYNLGTNTIKETFKPTVLPNGETVVFSGTKTTARSATISVSGNRKLATVTISNLTGSIRILGIANSGSESNCMYNVQVVDASTNQQIAAYRMIDGVYQQGYETVDEGRLSINDVLYRLVGDYYSFNGLPCGSTKTIQAVQNCDIETNIYYGSAKDNTYTIASNQLVDGDFAIPLPDSGSDCSMSYTNPTATIDAGNMSIQYDDTDFAYSSYHNGFTGLKISPSNIVCGQPLDIYLNFAYDDVEAELFVTPLGEVEIGGRTQTFTVATNYVITSIKQNGQDCSFTRNGTDLTVTFNTSVECSDQIDVTYTYESSSCDPQSGYPKTWYTESSVTPVKLHDSLSVSGDDVNFTYGTSGDLYFTATQNTHTLYENNCQEESNTSSTVNIGGATKKSTSISNGVITMVFGITGKWSENGETEEKRFTVTFNVAQ